MPSNVDVCPRHGVSVVGVDYFCNHCYYLRDGVCVYGIPRRKRVVKSLRDVVDSFVDKRVRKGDD